MDATKPNSLSRVLKPIISQETWSATGFLLSTLFVGVWWFIIVTLVIVVGFTTVILGIGIPLLALACTLARTAADAERRRLRAIGVDLSAGVRRPQAEQSGWSRLRSDLRDPETYRNLAYVWLLLVLGPIWFSLTVVAWTVPLSFLLTPALVAVGFEPTASSEAGNWEIVIDTWPQAGAVAAVGAMLVPLAPRMVAKMARAHGRFSEQVLGHSQPIPAAVAVDGPGGRSDQRQQHGDGLTGSVGDNLDRRVASSQGVGR